MQQKMFKEKFPIYALDVPKAGSNYSSAGDILDYFQALIEADAKAGFIARFDHYSHTQSVDGSINPEIKDAQNIIFCFGWEIPSADPVAVRPRSFGVTEFEDRFVVNFMEAPNPVANDIMQTWLNGLLK